MKIICAVNNKGGVGKTTVTKIMLDYFSTIEKKSILGLDMDHQCNLSNRYLAMDIDQNEDKIPPLHPDADEEELYPGWDGRSSIADIFYAKPVLPYSTHIPNLDILPGNTNLLLNAEQVRKEEVVERIQNQLHAFLSLPEVHQTYEMVIIDTPPSKGPLTKSVIRAASHIVIPTVMEPQPIEGVFGMLQLWKQEQFKRKKENPIHLLGILPNMYSSNITLHRDLKQSLESNASISNFVLPVQLGRRVAFAEIDDKTTEPTSIFNLHDNNQAKEEALHFCKYISQRIFA